MASPAKMFKPHDSDDYAGFESDGITVFIEHDVLTGEMERDFLIAYLGKFRLSRKGKKLIIE